MSSLLQQPTTMKLPDTNYYNLSLVQFTQLKTTIPQRRTYDCDTISDAVTEGEELIMNDGVDGYFVLAEYENDDCEMVTEVVYQGGNPCYELNDKLEVVKS